MARKVGFHKYTIVYSHLLPLVLKSEGLVKEIADRPGVSGEFKRHWVYAKMIKYFPNRKHVDIAFALEIALRRVRGLL